MPPRADAEISPRPFRHAQRRSRFRHLVMITTVVVAMCLAASLSVLGLDRWVAQAGSAKAAAVPVQPSPRSMAARATPTRSVPEVAPITYPWRGAGTWAVAPGRSTLAGASGQLLRYRVAVEDGIENVEVAQFAADVDNTLADPRSWTGTGQFRLQRVDAAHPADFVVYLATPRTRGKLCGSPDTYTSCRNGDRVVLNVARWVNGASAFTGDLTAYRQYLVNHEVGHRLGRGHERCPGRGEPAPVMQQQTLGLHGCLPHIWPLLHGAQYRGPAGAYDDPVPNDEASGN